MKILRGGLWKFLDTRKGGFEKIRGTPKICILQNQQEGEGLLKNWAGGGLQQQQQQTLFPHLEITVDWRKDEMMNAKC